MGNKEYFGLLLKKSFKDTWSAFGLGNMPQLLTGLLVFFASLHFLSGNDPNLAADIVVEKIAVFKSVVIMALAVFAMNLFFFTPKKMVLQSEEEKNKAEETNGALIDEFHKKYIAQHPKDRDKLIKELRKVQSINNKYDRCSDFLKVSNLSADLLKRAEVFNFHELSSYMCKLRFAIEEKWIFDNPEVIRKNELSEDDTFKAKVRISVCCKELSKSCVDLLTNYTFEGDKLNRALSMYPDVTFNRPVSYDDEQLIIDILKR